MKDENILLIEYTSRFNKQRKAAPLEIKIAFREAFELFVDDSNHPNLRNHPLCYNLCMDVYFKKEIVYPFQGEKFKL